MQDPAAVLTSDISFVSDKWPFSQGARFTREAIARYGGAFLCDIKWKKTKQEIFQASKMMCGMFFPPLAVSCTAPTEISTRTLHKRTPEMTLNCHNMNCVYELLANLCHVKAKTRAWIHPKLGVIFFNDINSICFNISYDATDYITQSSRLFTLHLFTITPPTTY